MFICEYFNLGCSFSNVEVKKKTEAGYQIENAKCPEFHVDQW